MGEMSSPLNFWFPLLDLITDLDVHGKKYLFASSSDKCHRLNTCITFKISLFHSTSGSGFSLQKTPGRA